MTDLWHQEGTTLKLTLHPGQTRAWDSKKRFVFIVAGTQSGKTSFMPLLLNREIERHGRGDYLAVTATYDLFKLKFLPEMRRYFEDTFDWQYIASDRTIVRQDKPRMFTRIIMRSANAEGGLESATAKAAVLDECGQDDFTLTAWEAVQRRLSLSQGRVLAGTTPYNLGWLKTEIYDRWTAGDPDIQVIQFKSTMNPSFPVEEYNRMKGKLPDWKFKMFYDGEFSRPAGMIYGDWADDLIIPDFDIPPTWTRYMGIDFGAVNTATVWIAENPDSKKLYIYRETLEGDKSTVEHAKSILSYGEYARTWGGAKSEVQQRRDFAVAGLPISEPPISDVEAGIDRVIAALKEKRLYVFRSCRGILDEKGTYSRELDDSGQPTEKIKNKNNYHRLDALRYVISGIGKSAKINMTAEISNYVR